MSNHRPWLRTSTKLSRIFACRSWLHNVKRCSGLIAPGWVVPGGASPVVQRSRVAIGTRGLWANSLEGSRLGNEAECLPHSSRDPTCLSSSIKARLSELHQISRRPSYGCPKELGRKIDRRSSRGSTIRQSLEVSGVGLEMSHSTLLGTQGRLIIPLIARLGTQESRAVLGITGYRSGVRMEESSRHPPGPVLPGERKANN